MNLIEHLNWRYATKRMNGQIVPEQQLNNILEAVRLAPTSMGVQPFHCLIIRDQEILKKINAEACKQPQIIEGSHLIVFAAWKNFGLEQVEEYIHRISVTRSVSIESLSGFKTNLMGIAGRTAEQNYQWAARQAYIALGFGLVAAATELIDATPMEGFNPEALDKILGLEEKGLSSVCLLMLGYRDNATDYLVNAQKVRRNRDQLFSEI